MDVKLRQICICALFIYMMIMVHPSSSYAAKGVVAFRKYGCDYYIVETHSGYDILEWYGGNDPSKGDVLVGDYESYGMKDIYNLTLDTETRVWVEDYFVSKDRAVEIIYDKCG